MPDTTEVAWMMQADLIEELLKKQLKVMKNDMIAKYNEATVNAIKVSKRPIHIWSEFPRQAKLDEDGVHFDIPSLKMSTGVKVRV